MKTLALAGHVPVAVGLNQPGTYLQWNVFTISVANLVLIAVMVVIFGAALLLPFPAGRRHDAEPADAADPAVETAFAAAPGDERMWTARVRRRAMVALPPGKLLPDRQPAYVASWAYVFGVASVAALGVPIVSGFAIALGGTDWWRTNVVGHFFNSLHLWSVELFMALLVIHLWAKFWMAAWRGRRTLTCITGVVAFVASIVECFTGYLSQQNFDSQWISTSGKDAFNAVGVGAFFNLMNFGQMLLWHVVLIPVILVAIVGAHVLLVRVRGVSHPLPVTNPRGRAARRAARGRPGAMARPDQAVRHPQGRHDRVGDHPGAHGRAGRCCRLPMSRRLPSPAGFKPPRPTSSAPPQSILFAPANILGVRQPIDPARTFVLSPLASAAPTDPALARRSPPTTRPPPLSRSRGRPRTATRSPSPCSSWRPPRTRRRAPRRYGPGRRCRPPT